MLQPKGERDEAADCGLKITRKMIEAAVPVYEAWEEDHIFGDYTRAAPFAIRELAVEMFKAMAAVANSREPAKTPRESKSRP